MTLLFTCVFNKETQEVVGLKTSSAFWRGNLNCSILRRLYFVVSATHNLESDGDQSARRLTRCGAKKRSTGEIYCFQKIFRFAFNEPKAEGPSSGGSRQARRVVVVVAGFSRGDGSAALSTAARTVSCHRQLPNSSPILQLTIGLTFISLIVILRDISPELSPWPVEGVVYLSRSPLWYCIITVITVNKLTRH